MEGSRHSFSTLTGLCLVGAAVFIFLGVSHGAGWFAAAVACLLAAAWKGDRSVRIAAGLGLVLVLLASGYVVGRWLALHEGGEAPSSTPSVSTITAVHL